MGRAKLEIKKMTNQGARKVTYKKRRHGLLKKARELSVLCDIDIGVIMFSPSGELSTFSKDEKMEELLVRFAETYEHERTNGIVENDEYLNTVVHKLNDEQRLKMSRMKCVDLQIDNQKLQDTLHNMNQERSFYEEKSKLFGGSKCIELSESIKDLDTIKDDLEQALHDVQRQIEYLQQRELEEKTMELSPQAHSSALHQVQGQIEHLQQPEPEEKSKELSPQAHSAALHQVQGQIEHLQQQELEEKSKELSPQAHSSALHQVQGQIEHLQQRELKEKSKEMYPQAHLSDNVDGFDLTYMGSTQYGSSPSNSIDAHGDAQYLRKLWGQIVTEYNFGADWD